MLPVGSYKLATQFLDEHNPDWAPGTAVYTFVRGQQNEQTGNDLHRIDGIYWSYPPDHDDPYIDWRTVVASDSGLTIASDGVYGSYVGAVLTAKAFDSVTPGLGKWLVTMAAWLFAISTMISWSYYGEQGIVYLAGDRAVLWYKLVFCALAIVATAGLINTDVELDNLTGFGTGVMLVVNVPIMWLFGRQAMRAYHNYMDRLRAGRIGPDHPPPSIEDLISGRDVD